jgi:hypothetical protein
LIVAGSPILRSLKGGISAIGVHLGLSHSSELSADTHPLAQRTRKDGASGRHRGNIRALDPSLGFGISAAGSRFAHAR